MPKRSNVSLLQRFARKRKKGHLYVGAACNKPALMNDQQLIVCNSPS